MSKQLQKSLIIPGELHNQRIDSVLAQLLPEFSRSQLSGWIKSGLITVNKQPRKPKDKAVAGEVIDVNVSFALDPDDFNKSSPQDIPLHIIYEDDEVLVINKPAGLVVHPGAGNREHTLVNALLFHCPTLQHLPRAGIIHRLDKDTTGLLIIAKTLTAQTSLVRQMQAREIKRHYIALAQGHLISGGTIDTFYGRHPRNRLKMAVLNNGRQAITHYSINKQFHHMTLLDVELMTGRTHQIRVHLAHINHPVVGDPLYGRLRFPANVSDTLRTTIQQFTRQALHAHTLTFCHPETNEELTFTAPLPDDFKNLLDLLENDDDL